MQRQSDPKQISVWPSSHLMFSCLHLKSQNLNRYFLQCVYDLMPLAICQYSADMPTAIILVMGIFPIFEQFVVQSSPHEVKMSLMFQVSCMLAGIYLFRGSNQEGLNCDFVGATRPIFVWILWWFNKILLVN